MVLVQVIMRINIRGRQWKIDFISMPWHMQFRESVVGTLWPSITNSKTIGGQGEWNIIGCRKLAYVIRVVRCVFCEGFWAWFITFSEWKQCSTILIL